MIEPPPVASTTCRGGPLRRATGSTARDESCKCRRLPEPKLPPVKEDNQPPVHPLVPDRAHQLAVYQLAAALVAAALFSIAPAVWDIVEYVQIPRIAVVRGPLGAGAAALGRGAGRLHDLSRAASRLDERLGHHDLPALPGGDLRGRAGPRADFERVGPRRQLALQLADKLAGGKAVLWCLCMVSVSTILAFFAGRLSARWHKTEMFIRQTGLARGSV